MTLKVGEDCLLTLEEEIRTSEIARVSGYNRRIFLLRNNLLRLIVEEKPLDVPNLGQPKDALILLKDQ